MVEKPHSKRGFSHLSNRHLLFNHLTANRLPLSLHQNRNDNLTHIHSDIHSDNCNDRLH